MVNVLLAALVSSCLVDISVPSQLEIRLCHDENNFGLEELQARLVGEWELVMTTCFSNPSVGSESSTDFIATFLDSGELIVTKPDSPQIATIWSVNQKSTNMFEVVTDTHIGELQGTIVLCDDRVEFRLSYIDLCDHRFRRVE